MKSKRDHITPDFAPEAQFEIIQRTDHQPRPYVDAFEVPRDEQPARSIGRLTEIRGVPFSALND